MAQSKAIFFQIMLINYFALALGSGMYSNLSLKFFMVMFLLDALLNMFKLYLSISSKTLFLIRKVLANNSKI